MSYGRVTDPMRAVLRKYIPEGSRVLDVGSGDGSLARLLHADLHYNMVCVERRVLPDAYPDTIVAPLENVHTTIEKVSAVLWSWPDFSHGSANACVYAAVQCASLSHTGRLVVLSKNTDGVVCGDVLLWVIVSGYELLDYVDNVANTMLVYNMRRLEHGRALHPEERAALAAHRPISRPLSYETAYNKERRA